MTKAEFDVFCVLVRPWMAGVISSNAPSAQTVASLGFSRLASYFKTPFLQETKVVICDRIPLPPLRRMGLAKFAAYEKLNPPGISYLNTYFVARRFQADEGVHFHELVHVTQWQLLGSEAFLARYLHGLEGQEFQAESYRKATLEIMACELQSRFMAGGPAFDVENEVAARLVTSAADGVGFGADRVSSTRSKPNVPARLIFDRLS